MEDQPNNILVSISCLTYNHAPYIRKCLDGILMQDCNFDYEVLINDDFSTDGTREIIQEYQQKYPQIIKPILQNENLWSKGERGFNQKFNFPRAKGTYIAMCEGDDFWTHPHKLQIQVDFLNNNAEYAMVFHNATLLQNGILNSATALSKITNRDYSQEELFVNWLVPTASMVFRKEVVEHNTYTTISKEKDLIFGDNLLLMSSFLIGRARGLKENMSIYRIHSKGVSYNVDRKAIVALNKQNILFGKYFPNIKSSVPNMILNRYYVHLKIALKSFNLSDAIYFILQIIKMRIQYR